MGPTASILRQAGSPAAREAASVLASGSAVSREGLQDPLRTLGVGGNRTWGPTQTRWEDHIRSSAASIMGKDGCLHLRVFPKHCKPVRYLRLVLTS